MHRHAELRHYSVGLAWLTFTAGALLIVFGGITDRLIPLFAVGAFLAFTLWAECGGNGATMSSVRRKAPA